MGREKTFWFKLIRGLKNQVFKKSGFHCVLNYCHYVNKGTGNSPSGSTTLTDKNSKYSISYNSIDSLQTGSPYGLIVQRFAFKRHAGGRERESLQWSLYNLSSASFPVDWSVKLSN